MYTPSHFEMPKKECLSLIRSVAFGQIIVLNEGIIKQAYIPFELDPEERFLFAHIAKKNDLLEGLSDKQGVMVNFLGEHAYISPNWYLSTEQVPTWNYQAVEIEGTISLLNDEETLKVITRLSDEHEQQFEKPWTMDKLPEKKTNAMLRAIVGFQVEITKVSGKSKMSQNKSLEDKKSVAKGLKATSKDINHRVATLIEKSLPTIS